MKTLGRKIVFTALSLFVAGCAASTSVPKHGPIDRPMRSASEISATTTTLRTIGFFGDTHVDSVNFALNATHSAITADGVSRMAAEGCQDILLLGDTMNHGYWKEATDAAAIMGAFYPHHVLATSGNHDPEDTRLTNPWHPFWSTFHTYQTQMWDDKIARLRLISWWSVWNNMDVTDSTAVAQRALLDYFCKTTPENWELVIAQHYPAYSQIYRGGAQPVQQDWFVPQIAERYKVDLVLGAHSHGGPEVYCVALGKPIFVVSGGGGMELSTVVPNFQYNFFYLNLWRDAGAPTMRHHYGVLRVSDAGLDVAFTSIAAADGPGGELLYQFFSPRQTINRRVL